MAFILISFICLFIYLFFLEGAGGGGVGGEAHEPPSSFNWTQGAPEGGPNQFSDENL